MSMPFACTTGIASTRRRVVADRGLPQLDRGSEVVDDTTVRILPAGDDLEHEIDVAGAGLGEGCKHARRIDDAGRVVLSGERPMMIGEAVRLLQLHLGEATPEAPQPRVWVTFVSGRPGHALMADVEAELPRHVFDVAAGEQILD